MSIDGDLRVTNYELTARAIDGKETMVSCNATTFYDRGRHLQRVFAAAPDFEHTVRQHEIQRERDPAHAAETAVVNQELEAFRGSPSGTPFGPPEGCA